MKNLLPLLLFLAFLGCKKDNVDKTPELLAKSWKMTAYDCLTPLNGTPLEGYSTDWFSAGTCRCDQIQTFKLGGTFIYENAPACNFEKDIMGTWTLSDNNTIINVTSTGGGYGDFSYTIVELTSSKLVVTCIEKTLLPNSVIMDLLVKYEFVPK
jgi:hypothetical protein